MLTFKHVGYNKQELNVLVKVITQAQNNPTLTQTCQSVNHCEKCPVKNICVDLANLKAYIVKLTEK